MLMDYLVTRRGGQVVGYAQDLSERLRRDCYHVHLEKSENEGTNYHQIICSVCVFDQGAVAPGQLAATERRQIFTR